jgi:RNA polymerase sigma-54 factor
MTLAPRLGLTQGQRLALTPSMRKTLDMLRLSAFDVDRAIATELRENPFLVRAPTGRAEPRSMPTPSGGDDFAATPQLIERLHRQIGLMHLSPEVRAMAEYLAGELRDDGYLDIPLSEIAGDIGVTPELAEAGLSALQHCDPPGVGARGLAECLALQLVEKAGIARPIADAAVARLEEFASGRLGGLAPALGVDKDTVTRIAATLPHLASQPVQEAAAPIRYLKADLVVVRDAPGTVTVTLAKRRTQRLQLDHRLVAAAGATEGAAEWRSRAEALIAALRFRAETLLRIGRHIAEVQHATFSGREDTIRPLSRRAVAEALGLHPSTVGRAVASKVIEIDGRLRPLSDFFSHAIPGTDGATVSAHLVRRRIAAMIAAESPDAPLSDAVLCHRLNAEGVDIARRTVTKYRQWMRLPSSSGRRRIALNRRLMAGQESIPKE